MKAPKHCPFCHCMLRTYDHHPLDPYCEKDHVYYQTDLNNKVKSISIGLPVEKMGSEKYYHITLHLKNMTWDLCSGMVPIFKLPPLEITDLFDIDKLCQKVKIYLLFS